MQRQRSEEKEQGSDILGKVVKYGPFVAAAFGAAAAAAYTVKEYKTETCDPHFSEELFHTTITKDRKERNHLGSVIRCLTDGNINLDTVNQHGFAPIHVACQSGNISTVQALLPFRPNLRLRTATGLTPLELVQASKELKLDHRKELEVIEYILKVCDPHDSPITPTTPTGSTPQWSEEHLSEPQYNCYKITRPTLISYKPPGVKYVNGARVLCIDGGGTRGFVPLEFLDYIENWFPEGHPPLERKFKINEYFDWIAGTSTGGLIALYLSLGHSVAACRKMYFSLKDKVFTGSRPYNARKFEEELKRAYGENTRMCDINVKQVRCVITSTTGCAEHLERVLFTNYDPLTSNEFVWKVARCTTAAPYFFDPFQDPETKVYYYDGGLTANNPTQAVLTEINRFTPAKFANGLILSLGTGKAPESESLNLTVYRSPMSLASMLTSLFKTLINQVSKSDGEVVQDAMTTCTQARCFYYRLTPTLPESVMLDETDNEKLLNMIYHAKAYTSIYKNEINDICLKLLAAINKGEACVIM